MKAITEHFLINCFRIYVHLCFIKEVERSEVGSLPENVQETDLRLVV